MKLIRRNNLVIAVISALVFQLTISTAPLSAAAPSVPANVVARESVSDPYLNGSLTVTWDAVTNATSYSARITRASTNETTLISTKSGSDTQALFTGLVGGASYAVQVRAFTGVDASAWTPSSYVATPKTLPKSPQPPTVVTGIREATLTWSAPSFEEAGGYEVSSYQLTEIKSGATVTVAGNVTTKVMTGLSNGATTEFTLKVITAAGSTGAVSDKP